MNREIKFRAWDIKGKRMVDSALNKDNYESGMLTLTFTGNLVWNYYDNWNWKNDEYVLMQYTGLKDRNDKEIHEGDIVYNGQEYRRVVWAKTGFWFASIHGKDKLIEPTADEVKNWEVVGNIFEDAEFFLKNYEK